MFRSDASDVQRGDLPVDQAGVPAAVAASWRTAETQVFTALLGRPDLYQAVVALVGATVHRLRQLGPSTGALVAAAATITTSVREARADGGLAADEIDPDLVGRAALALRHREIVGEQAAARRRDLMAAARARGVGWVVLEEVGDWAGDPVVPYRRLEAHATTGHALLVTATPDDDFRASRHAVDVLFIDRDTGGIEQSRDHDNEPDTHPSAADREVHVRALRERLSRPG